MNITEFLEARISEDEKLAKACDSIEWRIISEDDTRHQLWVEGLSIAAADSTWDACIAVADAEHAVRHDPTRVLAECAAKRVVLELARQAIEDEKEFDDYEWQGTVERAEPWTGDAILHAIAAVYKDHPDYQKEWG